jgi:hypothetical protein
MLVGTGYKKFESFTCIHSNRVLSIHSFSTMVNYTPCTSTHHSRPQCDQQREAFALQIQALSAEFETTGSIGIHFLTGEGPSGKTHGSCWEDVWKKYSELMRKAHK